MAGTALIGGLTDEPPEPNTDRSHEEPTTENTDKNSGRRSGRPENLTPWKPGQSGNPGGRPKMAPLAHACRELLAKPVPSDPKGRTYADVIAQMLADKALAGDIRAAQELADRAEGRTRQHVEFARASVRDAFERMSSQELETYAREGDSNNPRPEDFPIGSIESRAAARALAEAKRPITITVVTLGETPGGMKLASQVPPTAAATLASERTAERPIMVTYAGSGDEPGEPKAASHAQRSASPIPFHDKAARREPARALNKPTEASNSTGYLDWSASEMEAAREARVIEYDKYLARRNRIRRRR